MYVFLNLLNAIFNNVCIYRSFKVKPVTRVELNKRARRKETLKKEAETKKVEQLSKEIDRYGDIYFSYI